MYRIVRGMLTGGLLGLAAAGAVMVVGRRRRQRLLEMRKVRMLRHRARRTFGTVREGALRFGSALRSGTAAFSERMSERRAWEHT